MPYGSCSFTSASPAAATATSALTSWRCIRCFGFCPSPASSPSPWAGSAVPLLEVRAVSKSFRGLRAVHEASLAIAEGDIQALIGPNGAGKTTIFNMIAGVYAPDRGEIVFDGRAIHGLRPEQICAAGIGRTFQIVKPFRSEERRVGKEERL